MISGALEGFTCIDVSGHVAGPYASSLLGDLGCNMVKLKLPDDGSTFGFEGGPESRWLSCLTAFPGQRQ